MSAAGPLDAAAVWAALSKVRDPELPVSVVDLGLVYDVRVMHDLIEVDVTFTSMGCPCQDWIVDDLRESLRSVSGDARVEICMVWDPPWSPERISAVGRSALAACGVTV